MSLRLTSLRKRYGSAVALDEVSFEIQRGEIFGLLGPNGAGKTSCLECILGLRGADGGEIFWGDLNLREAPAAARRKFGAQLQLATLQDAITPREALDLFGGFYADAEKSDALLSRFGLEDKARTRFAALSGGQKQRLFLALALVNCPELLVLDEPTAGLDPQGRRVLHDLIRALPEERHCTVLLSTHDLNEAETLCHRVAILHRGRILAVDSPDALIARCRVAPRLRFRLTRELSQIEITQLSVSASCSLANGYWSMPAPDPNAAIAQLIERLRPLRADVRELHVQRPSLEDVFLELTGTLYPDSEYKPEVSA